mmetsp:Transcript_101098/g.263616  ORF Transcript_101098/g.263616 Transcript_101098/m.263616 type:complete len:539 (+) Transcript_101098:68-1684(+)
MRRMRALCFLGLPVCLSAISQTSALRSNIRHVDLDAPSKLNVKSKVHVLSFLDVDAQAKPSLALTGDLSTEMSEASRILHEAEFEKDFEVTLNMTHAHASGLKLGLGLGWSTDECPVFIDKISNQSLMEEWNSANPDKAVQEFDQIVRVNDIPWSGSAVLFMSHIKEQFEAGRALLPGAGDTMMLRVQRPRLQSALRLAAEQPEGLDLQGYAKEFSAQLSVPEGETSLKSMDSVLGWKLITKADWEPVTIGKILQGGVLAQWNKANPHDPILEGDEILHINKRHWQHNSTVFLSHLQFNYEHRKTLTSTGAFSLGLRRPWRVQAAYDVAHPVKVVDYWQMHKVTARLPMQKMKGGLNKTLGWQLDVNNSDGSVRIGKVRNEGLLASWNAAHPYQAVSPGDQLVEVNGIPFDAHEGGFAAKVIREFEDSHSRSETVSLVLQRRARRLASYAAADEDAGNEDADQDPEHDGASAPTNSSLSAAEASEAARVAEKIEHAMRYWNKKFPDRQIDMSSKLFSDALALHVAKVDITFDPSGQGD